jgi:nitroimidazol reductase NimA-like FMN-containing flavoprotein (pyridoxamine 5'-phosphate oxidase superfamily)
MSDSVGSSEAPAVPPSERTTLRRKAHRAEYERAAINAILDEAYVGHVGLQTDNGPLVLPFVYGREGDSLYLHGSAANHLLRAAKPAEIEICLTVTLIDGLVLARAAFNQCLNYRSVVVMGTATEVTDLTEKARALDILIDHVMPGRSGDIRPGSEKELRATTLLKLPMREVSAKVRQGGPEDEPEDYDLPIWAGVIAARTTYEPAVTDPAARPGLEPPAYAQRYARPAAG